MALTKVSTDGVKDDAITKTKIPANQIEASELADNAVDTNAIADQAVALSKLPHGTSSNDGKFLRANNGADPTFETVTGTTINNNADNRVITGSGTANTLNGEANLTYDGSKLTVQGDNGLVVQTATAPSSNTDPSGEIFFNNSSNNNVNAKITTFRNAGTSGGDLAFFTRTHGDGTNTEGEERMRINSSGRVGIGTTSPNQKLNVQDTTQHSLIRVVAKNDSDAGIDFGDPDDDDKARIRYHNNGDYMTFRVNGTDRLHIQSGGGISFNSDLAAANALDDYEEGNHTFTNNEGVSMTSNRGYYIKIGSYVFLSGSVNVGSNSQSSTLTLSLPFNSNINSYFAGGGYITYTNIDSSYQTNLMVSVENAGSNMHFRYQAGSNLSASVFSGKRIDFSVHYQRT